MSFSTRPSPFSPSARPGSSLSGRERPRRRRTARSGGGTAARPVARAALLGSLVLFPGVVFPGLAEAQERSLTWTQVTQIEMPGTLGTVLRATGALNERRTDHAIYLSGSVLRQDDGSQSFIFDAENRRYLTVDHETRTYIEFTMEESVQVAREMSEVMREARSGADEAMAEAQAERDEALEELRRSMDAMQEAMTFRIRTEPTGERRSFGGMSAERFLITAELEAREGVEGMDEVEGGQIVFLVELWQTQDFPDVDAFMEDWARAMAEDPAMQALAEEMSEIFEPLAGDAASADMLALWDPRIAAGVKQVMEATEALEGTTLESRTLVALVEPGARLDRAELLAWEPASMGDQIRDQAGDAARAAAADAARGAIRGLTRGRLGGGGGDEPAVREDPRVRPMLRVTSRKENPLYAPSNTSGLNPLYQGLEDYRRLTLQDLLEEALRGPGGA